MVALNWFANIQTQMAAWNIQVTVYCTYSTIFDGENFDECIVIRQNISLTSYKAIAYNGQSVNIFPVKIFLNFYTIRISPNKF